MERSRYCNRKSYKERIVDMLISKTQAQNAVNDYVGELVNAKAKIRKNFNEMDLENVDIRDKIENEIINVEDAIDIAIRELTLMIFE